MELTSIQLDKNTKKKLESKKIYSRESYNSVLKRMLEKESMPSMEEMFSKGDKIQQKKIYSTKEVIDMSHELRSKK